MSALKFVDSHNMVAFLAKPTESEGFDQIVDFLNTNPIKYALTAYSLQSILHVSSSFWVFLTSKVKTINGDVQLHALMDKKKVIITKSIIRIDLQLEDAEVVMSADSAMTYTSVHSEAILEGSTKRAGTELDQEVDQEAKLDKIKKKPEMKKLTQRVNAADRVTTANG
ncbi:hypothetical protein Tco_0393412 [Tanacetum coccineum]